MALHRIILTHHSDLASFIEDIKGIEIHISPERLVWAPDALGIDDKYHRALWGWWLNYFFDKKGRISPQHNQPSIALHSDGDADREIITRLKLQLSNSIRISKEIDLEAVKASMPTIICHAEDCEYYIDWDIDDEGRDLTHYDKRDRMKRFGDRENLKKYRQFARDLLPMEEDN